jgi:hypothetical protein
VKDGATVRPTSFARLEPADRQRDALAAVLETLDPKALMLPERLLDQIPPQAFNRPDGTAERFAGKTGLVFDPVAAAVTAADLAVSGLLNSQRAARLIESHARDAKAPGFDDVVNTLVWKTCDAPPGDGRVGAVARAVQWLVVNRLIGLAGDEFADPRVRVVVLHALWSFADRIEIRANNGGDASFFKDPQGWAIAQEIRRFLNRPDATHRRAEPPTSPPGDPIGGEG